MASKLNFATQLQANITQFAQLMDRLGDNQSSYFDRTFQAGGANAIVDADVASLNITAVQVGSAITFIQQLQKLLANTAPTVGAYQTTIDQVRNDV